MDQFRLVSSQSSYTQPATASKNGSRPNQQASPAKSKQRRHKHSEEEWNELRDIITCLYIEEDKMAEEVLEILNTQHNFQVGLRKLKDWLKVNGISKNVQKSDMFVLYAKRQARMITDGKKTIIYKDGRVLDDSRLDRFGERNYLDVDHSIYLAAATPAGYTYATPQVAAFDEDSEVFSDPSLFEVFTARRHVRTIFGDVLDNESYQEQNGHIHQIGVFGLRIGSERRAENLPIVLRQCLLLARDLMSFVTSSSSAPLANYVSTRPAPNKRVSKVQIKFTGDTQDMFTTPMKNGIISHLKHSETVLQLLQLGSADQEKWKQDWYAMTPEEQATSKRLCEALFGLPSSFNSAMSFMHISVLLASPKDPLDTVLVRVSLGVDIRDFPDCNTCQRQVVSLDCISTTGAVQLNVPLRSTWNGRWEPLRILTTEISEHGKWSDHVYSLRGWFVHLSSYLHRFRSIFESYFNNSESENIIEDETEMWEETWDPMDVFTPLAAFQPYDIATPASLCAYNDFELTQPQAIGGEDDSPKFAPYPTDDDIWDPNGI